MKKSCSSLRGILSLIISASMLTVPVSSAYSRDNDNPFASSRRVTTGKLLPPGVPVPGVGVPVPGGPFPVPVPTPPVVIERERTPPVVVEKHRDYDRYRDRDRDRHDDRDWDRGRDRKHRDKWSSKHRPYHGRVYRTLPTDVFSLTLGGGTFFYHFGTYYRHTGAGYVVVEAPVGARVRILPDDCSDFYADGIRYYECGDVYYESVDGDFIVIEGPPRGYRWEAEIGEEVWIKADNLNIRSGPGRRYRAIGQLDRGDVVEVSGKEGDWYSVRLRGGSYGWILKEHARPYRHRLHGNG
ncbi:MAG: hypothetical protein A2X81_15790 [Desulfobacterales bacterium GWB2_56_26]|nr:MAG: hypothetical protein A2X81_15790 [Desulfobacterales bacterium GWB2_56_26]